MRRTVLTAVAAVVLAASVVPASTWERSAHLSPCDAHWSKSTPTAGHALVTTLQVSCDQEEVASLDLTTKVQDLKAQAVTVCTRAVVGASADLTCTGPVVKLRQVYDLTYSFTAHGRYGDLSYAVCADDGPCLHQSSGGPDCQGGGPGLFEHSDSVGSYTCKARAIAPLT